MGRFTVAVPREDAPAERRVALVPEQVRTLNSAGFGVLAEPGAGQSARFSEESYVGAGARLTSRTALCTNADALVGVGRPAKDLELALRPGQLVIGLLGTPSDPGYAEHLATLGVTVVDFAALPRTLSRAQ